MRPCFFYFLRPTSKAPLRTEDIQFHLRNGLEFKTALVLALFWTNSFWNSNIIRIQHTCKPKNRL